MAKKQKHKYIFNTHSLSVEKHKVSHKEKWRRFLFYLSLSIVIFGISLFISFNYFNSPKQKKLQNDIDQAKRQYMQQEKRIHQLTLVIDNIKHRDDDLYRMIFEAEPHKSSLKYFASEDYSRFDENAISTAIRKNAENLDILTKKVYDQSKSFDEIYAMAKSKKEMMVSMPAIFPVNKHQTRLVSGFGMRLHPIFRSFIMHTGIDFAGPAGTPIYATGNGTVEVSGYQEGYSGYGLVCQINHGFGFQTLYAHMSKTIVRPGQKIKRGDLIGYIGSTGTSTAPHLHYEVIVKGKQVNPVYYFFNDLTPDEYVKVMEKANEVNQSLS